MPPMTRYVHLQGEKRFLLLPPSHWRHTYTYPLLHPSYGQCQVNMTSPDRSRYALATAFGGEVEGALEVVLQPGDLLYLPPFWLHEVRDVMNTVGIVYV